MTLQETMINQELANVDLNRIAALQQKRTLAFVNHFVLTNVRFLNSFMKKCEQKMMEFERKLEKVNAAMVLLEAKLSSIPEVNTADVSPTKLPSEDADTKLEEVANPKSTTEEIKVPEASSENVDAVQSKPEPHPEYNRFVKMVQVGVPLQAVKLKVSLEGLDPNVLDKILGN